MASFQFCSECNNLLYPKEDRANRVLLMACRNCAHQEEAENYCIFRHELESRPSEETMNVAGFINDPTLPRANVECSRCGHNEAAFFQAQSRRAETKMTLYYVCGNPECGNRWTSLDLA